MVADVDGVDYVAHSFQGMSGFFEVDVEGGRDVRWLGCQFDSGC